MGVTGSAALSAACNSAFNGIDTKLLYAAGGVVVVLLLVTYRSPWLWLLPVISVGLCVEVVEAIVYAAARAIVASLLILATVVVSFAATFGASTVIFRYLLGLAGIDPTIPLYVFIFLVALGVDYNIFLMTRVREETAVVGARAGARRGLAVTGGVITSAGAVLAGTFAVLAVLPLVQLTEVGVAVAFGVLLDTIVVRSVLLPALVLDIGPAVWWPGRLARAAKRSGGETVGREEAGQLSDEWRYSYSTTTGAGLSPSTSAGLKMSVSRW